MLISLSQRLDEKLDDHAYITPGLGDAEIVCLVQNSFS